MIIAAAVRYCGATFALEKPARHQDVREEFIALKGKKREDMIEGFIDSEKGFVGRHEALCIALACGQDLLWNKGVEGMEMRYRFCSPENGLLSEDVW